MSYTYLKLWEYQICISHNQGTMYETHSTMMDNYHKVHLIPTSISLQSSFIFKIITLDIQWYTSFMTNSIQIEMVNFPPLPVATSSITLSGEMHLRPKSFLCIYFTTRVSVIIFIHYSEPPAKILFI